MRNLWKQFRIWAILASFCVLALGVVLILWPEVSAVVACCILGALSILYGLYQIVRYFNFDIKAIFFRFDLALGICDILIGILLMSYHNDAILLLPIMTGVLLILESVLNIQISAELHRAGIQRWGVTLIFGIVSLVLAVFLILNPFEGVSVLMMFVGICLMITAIESLCLTHSISKAIKSNHDYDVIDAEWTSL